MSDLNWKVGDTLPPANIQLIETDPESLVDPPDRQPIDLTTADSVTIVAVPFDSRANIEITATPDPDQNTNRGWISFEPGALTERAMDYLATAVIVWPGPEQQSVPNDTAFRIRVTA